MDILQLNLNNRITEILHSNDITTVEGLCRHTWDGINCMLHDGRLRTERRCDMFWWIEDVEKAVNLAGYRLSEKPDRGLSIKELELTDWMENRLNKKGVYTVGDLQDHLENGINRLRINIGLGRGTYIAAFRKYRILEG